MERKRINTPKFNLKEPRSKVSTVFLSYVLGNGSRLRYSTAKKVKTKFWDKKTGLVKETLDYPESKELNVYLRNLQNQLIELVKVERTLSIPQIKKKLDQFNGLTIGPDKTGYTLIDFANEYIKNSKKHHRTIQKYEGVRNHLIGYSKQRGMILTFDKFTIDWKNDFVEYLKMDKQSPKDSTKTIKGIESDNTLNKIIATVKRLLKESSTKNVVIDGVLRPLHQNPIYNNDDFAVKRIKTTKHYLKLNELRTLSNLDLSAKPSYEIVRDYFLMMCYTGLRWSDIIRLTKEHFIDDVIHLHTYKGRTTKADNEIANYQLPNKLSEQKHNDYIKEICEMAKINRIVIHKESSKGEIIESKLPVYTKVSNHTGRYTFINFMINDYKVTPMELTKITGQSLKVLLGYEQGNKPENAKSVLAKINSKRLRKVN